MERLHVLTFRTVNHAIDFLLFMAAYALGWSAWALIVFGSVKNLPLGHFHEPGPFIILYALFYVNNFFALTYFKAYHSSRLRSYALMVGIYCKSCVLGLLFTVLIAFLLPEILTSRVLLVSSTISAILLLSVKESVMRRLLANRRKSGRYLRTALIVGENARLISEIVAEAEHDYLLGLRLIGVVRPTKKKGRVQRNANELPLPILGPLSQLVNIIDEQFVGTVIIFADELASDELKDAMWLCEERGLEVWLKIDVFDRLIYRAVIGSFRGIAFINLRGGPDNTVALLVKEVIDRLVSATLIAGLSPLFVLTAVLVRTSSPGPIFFKQVRGGLNGRHFVLYKFRSMVLDADEQREDLLQNNELEGPAFKLSEDPRVTKIGRFLRKSSLDELPQLWNVLRGDMSLVGPRPLRIEEVAMMEGWHRRRFSMKPGITGIWQVEGRSDLVDFDTWMNLDLHYIDNWSLFLDLRLLFKTIPAVLFGRGAR